MAGCHIRDYNTGCTAAGLGDLLTSGSHRGSLSAVGGWCWMVRPRVRSRSWLESRRDRSWDRSFSWCLLVTFRTVSGHLFVSLRTIVFCIGALVRSLIAGFCREGLSSLAQWETDWQMKFNVAKCHSMRVTRHLPSNQIHFNYSLHQQTLEQVRSAKYLGLTISDDLEWDQHISEISCKATKALGFLRRIWLLHLGTQRRLHTKHWFVLSLSMQLLFGTPIIKLRQK